MGPTMGQTYASWAFYFFFLCKKGATLFFFFFQYNRQLVEYINLHWAPTRDPNMCDPTRRVKEERTCTPTRDESESFEPKLGHHAK
jgi:hypothetical protein